MKATYFFSQIQKESISDRLEIEGLSYKEKFIDGKEFTEVDTSDGEHVSNFPNATIVHVKEDLPVDEFMLKHFGKRYAKTF